MKLLSEKYRPNKISEMVGDARLLNLLQSYIESKNVPNLLFYGPVGVGKTTAAHCIINELYGEYASFCFVEFNATELNKDEVNERIKKLATTYSIAQHEVGIPYKICIIDECENMTKSVESSLRTLMEGSFSKNLRFILICNDIEHKAITEPIKSRCTLVQFGLLKPHDILRRLELINSKENFRMSDSELIHIARKSKGDMRTAINELVRSSMKARPTLFDVDGFITNLLGDR